MFIILCTHVAHIPCTNVHIIPITRVPNILKLYITAYFLIFDSSISIDFNVLQVDIS